MNTKLFLTCVLTLSSLSAFANMERKLFTMEKNFNPENVMIIHTQTDKDCRFIPSPKNAENNYVEFYWLLDHGAQKKEVHSAIRGEIKKRVKFESINSKRDSFRVRLNDLSELRHDLSDNSIEVLSEVSNGKCSVKSVLALGASGNYRKMNLKRVYCDVSKNLVGMPNGCHSITLDGTDVDTGEQLSVKFKKK